VKTEAARFRRARGLRRLYLNKMKPFLPGHSLDALASYFFLQKDLEKCRLGKGIVKPPHNKTRYSNIRGFNDTIVGPARFW